MRKIKSIVALMLVVLMTVTLFGCERKQTVSEYYIEGESEEQEDTNSTADTGTASKSTTSDSGKSTKSTETKKGVKRDGNIWKIDRDVKAGASNSVLNGLNFGGKTLRMLVHQENYTDLLESQIKEFGKKYNATIKVDIVNFEENLSAMATSLSAGKPYDIILCHSAFFPQIAVTNLCQPLESVISSKDLATQYGKRGLNWKSMLQSATWANHIYYTIDNKPSYLPICYYNKLLIEDYGLEDPMELYKKGQWTYDKILEYGKIVANANQDVQFFDASMLPSVGADFYKIEDDGTVKWLGANSDMSKGYENRRKFQKVSSLSGSNSLADNMINGKVICAKMEAEKLVGYTKALQGSAALGKDINNLGVCPMPLNSDGTYAPNAPVGYAASRGTDPKAAVALAVYLSDKKASWTDSSIPALKSNESTLSALYNKFSYKGGCYYFLSSDGQRIEQKIFNMTNDINNGGDIMKLLQSYAPTVKSIIEYNLEKQ